MQSNDKSKKIIIILTILLVISLGYITINKYKTMQEERLLTAYKDGYTKGIKEAVISVYQQTNDCNPTVIKIGNVSRQLFDVACLQNTQQ